jgi:hypothetical protein
VYAQLARSILKWEFVRQAPGPDLLGLPNDFDDIFMPLALDPGPRPGTMVPTYPIGFPMLMALGALIAGWEYGPFLVPPVVGLLSILLIYLAGLELGLPRGFSIAGAIMLAASPTFIHYSTQPMSDAVAMFWSLTAILAALRREVEQLPATHRAVRELVKEATKATTELNQQAGATLAATERVARGVDRALPALSEKLGTSMESIDAAAVQLKKTGEEAQATLRSARPLLDRGESAAREAGDVLSAAKRVWPLSDTFKEASDGMLPIDSFEAQGKGRVR